MATPGSADVEHATGREVGILAGVVLLLAGTYLIVR